MFSYISVEQRASNDHPLRTIPLLVDGVLHQLGPRFDSIYAKSARPSIAPEQGRLDVTFANCRLQFGSLWLQFLFRYSTLELNEAMELADELLAAAEDTKNPAMLLAGNTARGTTLYFLGKLVSANEHLEKALAVFRPPAALSGTCARKPTHARAIPAILR